MDILRKELNAIYSAQELDREVLDRDSVAAETARIREYVAVNDGCCVITDAAADSSLIIAGSLGRILGLTQGPSLSRMVNSSDEDEIYLLMHPEDLAEKRMLEYEFFKHVTRPDTDDMLHYKAACTIRLRTPGGEFLYIDNTTQVLRKSGAGKMWLILCCYNLAAVARSTPGIAPRIIDTHTGAVTTVATDDRRRHILSPREKEILLLIRDGKPSKQIADLLNISVHTVSRHRQNIISKLSVGSTYEAIMAATLMKLI